jgi:hypothetical protein
MRSSGWRHLQTHAEHDRRGEGYGAINGEEREI